MGGGMFYDVPPAGAGFNADQLHEATLRNIWNKLKDENPAVLQESREALKQQIKAAVAVANAKTKLAQALGTDGVKLALEALTKDAEAQIRLEEAAAAQARELAAIEAAKQRAEAPKPAAVAHEVAQAFAPASGANSRSNSKR